MKSKAFMTKIKISAKYFGTDFNYYYYSSDPIGPGKVRRSNKDNQELILVHTFYIPYLQCEDAISLG